MTGRRPLLALALLLACLAPATSATAATPGVTTYPVARKCLPPTPTLAAAPGEGVVVSECGGGAPANLLPSGRLVPLPGTEFPEGPTVFGPSGEAWVAVQEGSEYPRQPTIARVAPDGGVQRFPVPVAEPAQPFERLENIVVGLAIGPEGDLWAAIGEGGHAQTPYFATQGGELLRVTATGEMTAFPVPEEIEPRGLTLGPDGNLWFTGLQHAYSGEHSARVGVGWVGRMTPAGSLSLFRTPVRGSQPSAIAAAPDGVLWYVESSGNLGTFHADGTPGRRYLAEGWSPGGLVVGPEGDAWLVSSGGPLTRVTPSGQRTRFPVEYGPLAVGHEGDIWVLGWEGIDRVVPGAPGLDLLDLRADRRAGTVFLKVACGASTRACEGTIHLTLEIPGHRSGRVGVDRRPHYRFGATPYSVAAESRGTVRVKVPPQAIAIASKFSAGSTRSGRGLVVRATVAGGPPLSRLVAARSLLGTRQARRGEINAGDLPRPALGGDRQSGRGRGHARCESSEGISGQWLRWRLDHPGTGRRAPGSFVRRRRRSRDGPDPSLRRRDEVLKPVAPDGTRASRGRARWGSLDRGTRRRGRTPCRHRSRRPGGRSPELPGEGEVVGNGGPRPCPGW
jgi:streptogramin lyase